MPREKEMEFTKEPWEVSPHSDHEVWANKGTTLVCELPAIGDDGNSQDGDEPDETWYNPGARARLIAAAPELLKACEKAMLRHCGCHSSTGEDWHSAECAVPQLRAAIAKATRRCKWRM